MEKTRPAADEALAPIPDCMVTRIGAGLYEMADDEVPWLLLFLKEESDWHDADNGDFRKAGRLARVLESLPA